MTRTPLQRFVFHAILGLLLMACYPAQQLFSGNQNVYLLWGMAKAGIGSLHLDPILAEADPFPLFSLLVFGVMKFLHPWVFHLIYWMLNTVYVYALFGMAHHLFGLHGRAAKTALFTALFLLLHSGAIWAGLFRIMFGIDLSWAWDSGLAEQGVLRGYLQPSVLGVFLLLSLLYFLRNSARGTFLSLAAAAIFHANYIFIGGCMGLIYLLLFIRDRKVPLKQTVLWALVSVAVVLPQLLYVIVHFLPDSDEAAAALRQAVSQTQEGNIHLAPALWLNAKTALQLGIVAAGMWILRKEAVGRLILALVATSVVLSAITLLSGSQTLLSLTPWRFSVVLVPICVMLLLGRAVFAARNPDFPKWAISALLLGGTLLGSFAFYRVFGSADAGFLSLWRICTMAAATLLACVPWLPAKWTLRPALHIGITLCAIGGAIGSGVLEMMMEQRFRFALPEHGVIGYLKNNALVNEVVMIPTHVSSLRMNAGVAVVADEHLVHGLQLSELLERQRAVNAFYADPITAQRLEMLKRDFGCTAVLVPMEKEIPIDLQLSEIYRDAHYRLLRL
jgi:hypothetical protein